jgi:hypothetical protein
MKTFKIFKKKRSRITSFKKTASKRIVKNGRLCKILSVTDNKIVGRLSNKTQVIINANWVDNRNPVVLYDLNDMSNVKANLKKLQHCRIVYNYWTPFKVGKYVYVKIEKNGTATFIRGKK